MFLRFSLAVIRKKKEKLKLRKKKTFLLKTFKKNLIFLFCFLFTRLATKKEENSW